MMSIGNLSRPTKFDDLVTRPIKLQKNRVWRTYAGGELIESWQGLPAPRDSDFPEEWVASTVRARNVGREQLLDEGLSKIEEDTDQEVTLAAVIESNPVAFLGKNHVKKFGSNLAILSRSSILWNGCVFRSTRTGLSQGRLSTLHSARPKPGTSWAADRWMASNPLSCLDSSRE